MEAAVKMYMPVLTEVEKASQDALREVARTVLKTAKELAPKEDGTLAKSGRAKVDDLTATVKFTAPHAWLQHERTDYAHPNGGQAKYLEAAVEQTDVLAFFAGPVEARLRGRR